MAFSINFQISSQSSCCSEVSSNQTARGSSSRSVGNFFVLVSTSHPLAHTQMSNHWNQSFTSPLENSLGKLTCHSAILCYQCSNTQSNIFITRVDTILLTTTTATLIVTHLITELYIIINIMISKLQYYMPFHNKILTVI